MTRPSEEKRKLAHLLRRAGFGTRPAEWNEYSRLGLAATTERLLHPETVPDHLEEIFKSIGGDYVDFGNLDSVKQWWLYRMVHTRRPLEEKMTLFWHNHFATANYKVNNPGWMWQQNEMFRKHALGNFRTLLQAVTSDPAMLIWLDGGQNRNTAPNENFARELMELFTMGVGSGYKEKDIQEAARALTGWRYDDAGKTFIFDPYQHDDGEKTVLGHTGNFYSDDIVDIVVRQPATARFLSTKLFKFFVHDNPTANDIAKLAQVYFQSGYSVRAMLEYIFKLPVFYSEASYYTRIKSPVEFAVMTMRTLNAPMTTVAPLYNSITAMGQDLFNPPNVKGWLEGREWINSRTLLARVNFAIQLANEMNRRGALQNLVADFTPTGQAAGNNAPSMQGLAMEKPAMSGPAMQGGPATQGTKVQEKKALGGNKEGPAMSNPAMEGPVMAGPAMAGPAMAGPAMEGAAMAGPGKEEMRGPGTAAANQHVKATPEQVVDLLWDRLLPGHLPSDKTRALLINYVKEGETAGEVRLFAKLPGLVNLILAAPEYQLV